MRGASESGISGGTTFPTDDWATNAPTRTITPPMIWLVLNVSPSRISAKMLAATTSTYATAPPIAADSRWTAAAPAR